MAACGLTEQQVADVLEIQGSDVRLYYGRYYDTGVIHATAGVGSAILQTALDRRHPQHMVAAMFWARSRSGWRDVKAVEQKLEGKAKPEDRQALINDILDELLVKRKEKVGER
jgi:hypothetical protein